MTETYAQTRRKIDPSRGETLGDGSPNDNDRVEIGPTQLAFGEWVAAGLELPNLDRMRRARWEKLTQALVSRDYGGLLMFDPLNIRYATDTGGEVITLKRARCCVRWIGTRGFLGLTTEGPNKDCRIGPAAEELQLRDITSVALCTPTAVTAWEAAPWNR